MSTDIEEEVVIKKEKKKRRKKSEEPEQEIERDEESEEQSEDEIEATLQKQFRIVSILLFAAAAIFFVAMISYTAKDEANTEISISEFFRFIGGEEIVRTKFADIHNWLGIFGVLISNFMYNNLFGFAAIFTPVFFVLWGIHFFNSITVSRELLRKTLLYVMFAVLFATFTGTLQQTDMFYWLPKEWSGAIGQFMSNIFTGFIGTFGTFLLLMTFSVIGIIFGTNIDIQELLIKLNLTERQPFIWILAQKKKIESYLDGTAAREKPDTEEKMEVIDEREDATIYQTTPESVTIEREALPTDTTEPAQIIKRNLNRPNLANISNFADRFTKEQNPLNIIRDTNELDSTVANDDKPESIGLMEDSKAADVLSNNIPKQETEVKDELKEPEPTTPETKSVEQEPKAESPRDIIEKKRLELLGKLEHKQTAEPDKIEPIVESKPTRPTPASAATSGKKPLTVTVKDVDMEDDEIHPENVLSTFIHDEEINYSPPTRELVKENDIVAEVNDDELSENAKTLREKLETFKIEIDNLSVTPGPVVTQYEFVPAPGIKVSRIENLSDDIAMALKAKGIRIIAPIPGKGTVGIEIPNKKPSVVSFANIIKSSKFYQSEHKLPLALGKTIGGEVYITDLAKMPHLLIAGSTGSGKSVGINTILASLLFKKHPSELKFVIIDPKKVELNQYSMLEKHFMATSPDLEDIIITNPEDAVVILKSVVAEMDQRYDILAQVGQRNILDYNKKVKSGKYKNDKNIAHRQMPYIVVIIDELADLMLTASKEVEAPIIRLAQLARAVGIHLVVATQRPSVDVITGIIKANFPARLGYLVASKIDSRTILDQSGAEQLLGNGDMLFLPGGSPKPIRVQNSFISTDEVEAICEHIGDQKGYSQPYMLPSLIDKNAAAGGIAKEDRDPLFEESARMLINLQQASVSIIQRRMKVGYARAGKIIDELEDAGIVGPYAGSKARDVLLESEADLEFYL